MANASQTILLTFKGNVAQLNKSIDSSISKLNALVRATTTATAGAAASGSKGGLAGMLFGGQSSNILASGRKMIDSALSGLDNSVAKVTRSFGTLQRSVQSVGDALRLTSQAVSTMGRVWTVLISAPLGLFLKQQAGFAIDFEDQLKRVQKVTNWTTGELTDFRDMLRDVAINTATSHIELAKISEVIGQSGITDIPIMREMTETINMFAMATGIAADEAATNLIRIGNAFGWTKDKMATNTKKMGSVFNKLENTMAVTAKQVMAGTAEWAQQAEVLGISESAAAAYTSTLIAMGLSDSEAGTAMKRFTAGLIENSDAVVEAMKGIEGYGSAREVAAAIDANAEKVIMDIVYAAEAGNSAALKLADSLEIGGVRGGRAIVGLASNTDLLEESLRNAHNEWENGLSLVQEYELAMSSTKNQMALLKNNVNDIGVTIGDALLPMLNDVIMILVPAIRYVGAFLKTLDAGQKRMIVFGAIGAVALGPMLFLFGQIVNSFSLVFLGLGRLILLIPQLYGALVGLIKPILLVGRFFLSWPGLILVAITGILKILANAGIDIAGFFIDLGNRAVAWGENLAATYASGFLKGAVNFIAKALQWVANMIASFFQGHSPPKVGPLSTIDKWGSKVMESYLKGFLKADFGILSGVGRIIETALTRGLEGKKLAGALQKTAQARLRLSELIKEFNKTGKINDKVLGEITNNLGPISDNVRELIKHWLEYNRLQERIAQIEERRKEVKKSYTDELKAIAATNMTMQEKVEAIRAAQRARDDNLRGLTEEQEMLEEKSAKEKEAYEYQQEMIDAMQTQDDLLQRISDALKAAADALGGIGDELGGGFGSFDLPDPEEWGLTDTVNEAMDTLESRLSEGQKKFQGLLDGWFGNPNAIDQENMIRSKHTNMGPVDSDVESAYDTLYSIGEKAREIYDTIGTWSTKGAEFINEMKAGFAELKASIDLSSMMPEGGIGDIIDIEGIKAKLDSFKTSMEPFIGLLKDVWAELQTRLEPAAQKFGEAWSRVSESFQRLKSVSGPVVKILKAIGGVILGLLGGILVGIINGLVSGLATAVMGVANFLSGIMGAATGLIIFFQNLFNAIVALVHGDFAGMFVFMENAWRGFVEFIAGIGLAIWGLIQANFLSILAFLGGFIDSVAQFFVDLYMRLVGGSIIPDMINAIIEWFTSLPTKILTTIVTFVANVIAQFAILAVRAILWFASLVTNVLAKFETFKETMATKWEAIKSKAEEIWEAVKTAIIEKAQEIYDDVVAKVQEIIDEITAARTKMYTAGTNFLTGLWNGLKAKWESIKEWALEKFQWLTDLWAKINKEESPSKVQFEHGVNFMKGLQLGLEKGFVGVSGSLQNAYGSINPDVMLASTATINPIGLGGYTPTQTQSINININDPVVRSDDDIEEIVNRVKRVLTNDMRNQQAFGGYIR